MVTKLGLSARSTRVCYNLWEGKVLCESDAVLTFNVCLVVIGKLYQTGKITWIIAIFSGKIASPLTQV